MTLPLLAVGFASPLLLGGLGLAGIPIIIHLLSRRRFKRIEWGAIRWVLEAEKENRRRVQFEQWLLVALRCMAMALLALVMSRPFVESSLVAALLGASANSQRIIVIDDSASGAYRIANRPQFEAMTSATIRLLAWLAREAPQARVTIYRTSEPTAPIIEDAILSESRVNDLREQISQLQTRGLRAEPQVLLRVIAEKLRATPNVATELHIFADFQQSDWLRASAESQSVFASLRDVAAGAKSAGGRLPLRLILVYAGEEPRPNIAITQVAMERPQTIVGLPAIVRVGVSNISLRPLDASTLSVQLDDVSLPSAAIESIDAGSERSVSFEVTVGDEGFHVLTVGLAPRDGLAIDDARRLTLRAKAALAVLLVNGQPSADRAADEVHLARSAISPPGPFSSGLRADTIDPDQIDATDLGQYDVVFLCNVPPPSESAIDSLQRYVRAGGGLAVFAGDSITDVDEYNARFDVAGGSLLPLPVESIADAGAAASVGLVRMQKHPVTEMFPAGEESLSEYVRFRRFARLSESTAAAGASATSRPAAQILARFTDDRKSAAIVEREFGAGHILQFASTIDLDWNDWARAADGSYVVTLLEMTQHLARRENTPGEFIAGEPLVLPVLPDVYELRATLKSPLFPTEPAIDVAAPIVGDLAPGVMQKLSGPIARTVGVYQLDLSPRAGGIETRPLSVNLDVAESDTRIAARADLSRAVGDIPHEIVGAADDFLRSDEDNRRELWPPLLVLLLMTLLLEQTLAWRFGSARTVTPRTRLAPRSVREFSEPIRFAPADTLVRPQPPARKEQDATARDGR